MQQVKNWEIQRVEKCPNRVQGRINLEILHEDLQRSLGGGNGSQKTKKKERENTGIWGKK